MAETDVERLARIVLDELKGVNEHLDRHDGRFDAMDHRFDGLESELHSIRAELLLMQNDHKGLAVCVDNISGFRKEIDHALERIAAIEKHLGTSEKTGA